MANAIVNWQISAQYGSEWMLWERAEEKASPARRPRSGTILCVVERVRAAVAQRDHRTRSLSKRAGRVINTLAAVFSRHNSG
jgi:hypothetical protein